MGCNPNLVDESGHGPLYACASRGHLDVVRLLVQHKVLLFFLMLATPTWFSVILIHVVSFFSARL
jgi:hypothetical protein